jgi:hypothetical protein
MPTSLIEGNSLLAVDIGSVTTRAAFFDVVEGHYRFIGMGQAPSTATAPWGDVGIGVRLAVDNLQTKLSKSLLDSDQRLILPSQPDGAGVDTLVTTISAGATLKTVVVGLLSDVSLESAQHLARTTYSRVVETIGMSDLRKPEEQIDSILRVGPDLILVAGGTNGGATRSIQKITEMIGLVCYLLPEGRRPSVLFAGNTDLGGEFKAALGNLARLTRVGPNIRPSVDVEDIDPAQKELAEMVIGMRRQQIIGADDIFQMAGGSMQPTAYAYSRMIRFLGQVYKSNRGLLGVDLGASATTVAAVFDGNLRLNVFPQFGMGGPLANLLRYTSLEEIMQWLSVEIPVDTVRDYLYQKPLYPGTVPATVEDLAIEQAVARQNLSLAMRTAMSTYPRSKLPRSGLLPPFEPILVGGGTFGGAPSHGQSLLMTLDALQPVGVTQIILDQNNLLPMLGVAADKNTILPVHLMDSLAFASLGTVVSAISTANYGVPILRARLLYKDGNETKIEVKRGALEILPLARGEVARMRIRPIQRADVGLGPGRAIEADVNGGEFGVVIDARGRPLGLPSDEGRRRELIKKWLWTVGG